MRKLHALAVAVVTTFAVGCGVGTAGETDLEQYGETGSAESELKLKVCFEQLGFFDGGIQNLDPTKISGIIKSCLRDAGLPAIPSFDGGVPAIPSFDAGLPAIPGFDGGIPAIPGFDGGIPGLPGLPDAGAKPDGGSAKTGGFLQECNPGCTCDTGFKCNNPLKAPVCPAKFTMCIPG